MDGFTPDYTGVVLEKDAPKLPGYISCKNASHM